jgi:hypothetical protein
MTRRFINVLLWVFVGAFTFASIYFFMLGMAGLGLIYAGGTLTTLFLVWNN